MDDKYYVYVNGVFVATVFTEDAAWSAIERTVKSPKDLYEVLDGEGKVRSEFIITY